jgi:hypothetical protein
VTTWDQGVFGTGEVYIESLMAALPRFDFAVLVLTADDEVRSRSKDLTSPRDNVIFELGLFMGVLGRDRTFILQPRDSGLKIPTDLAGITASSFDWPRVDKNYKAAVATGAEVIREKIQTVGRRQTPQPDFLAGLDQTLVSDESGVVSARIGGCEIRVPDGRIESCSTSGDVAVVLPCNEYFDDECAGDRRSALGAYVGAIFPGRVSEFMSRVRSECEKTLGSPIERQKKDRERALSFGAGRAILILNPLDSTVPVALVSTTTQRAGTGLVAKSSFLFDGVCDLLTRLADVRINEVVMPVLGAGHGGMDAATAFVSLVLALAEAVRGTQGRPLRRVTIVNFKKDAEAPPSVHPVVVRRALALAGAPGHLGSAAVA